MLERETEAVARQIRIQSGLVIATLSMAVVLRATGTVDITVLALFFVIIEYTLRYREASTAIERHQNRLN